MIFTNQFALPLPRRNENLNTEVTPKHPPSATSPGYWEGFKPQSTDAKQRALNDKFINVIISDASKIYIPRAHSESKSKAKSSKTNTDL